MSKEILTEEQKEQVLLTNPEILKLVKRAIKRTKQETVKQMFKEIDKSMIMFSAKEYNKMRAKFLQEIEK